MILFFLLQELGTYIIRCFCVSGLRSWSVLSCSWQNISPGVRNRYGPLPSSPGLILMTRCTDLIGITYNAVRAHLSFGKGAPYILPGSSVLLIRNGVVPCCLGILPSALPVGSISCIHFWEWEKIWGKTWNCTLWLNNLTKKSPSLRIIYYGLDMKNPGKCVMELSARYSVLKPDTTRRCHSVLTRIIPVTRIIWII